MSNECVHYWIIEPVTAPESKGTCKKCGEIRMFANSMFINRRTGIEAVADYKRKAKEAQV